ncbi:MAG TPA: hypothetical protein ENK09_08280 [Nitrospirae bacterium]|nr:hypothetical protein [Nitrospirota bacterium]
MRFMNIILLFVVVLLIPSQAFTEEIKTRYTTIIYNSTDQLDNFNDNIITGGLSYFFQRQDSVTVKDEIVSKVDGLVEHVESILEMYPSMMHFRIVLLDDDNEVRAVYRRQYNKSVNYIAFYSPQEKTVYISVDDVELRVLAHEIAHVVIDHYFGVAPPVKIHEVLAQYVEKHLED